MSVFWIAAALMVLAALGFLVWPLSRGQERTKHDSRAINVALYREQLRELQADLASGSLSEEQYRESVSELERNLLQDVSSPATKPAVRKKNSPLIVASTALLPLFAIALYLAVGNPQSLTPKPQETAQAMLQQLQQHLKENPDDAEGWALLASVHFEIERYADAVSYFEKAVALRPGDAQLLADYADALARANEGRLEGKPVAMLEKSLQADPANIKALALSGAAAYGAGDFKRAADYWQRLLAKMPAGSEEMKLVQERIDDARSRAAANTGSNVRGAIRGTVSVSPNLQGQVRADDTLFVYAQAGDSKMPLSIVHARAKELPYSFVLDDSKGMAGGIKLSSADEVRVVARISKSGQAKIAAGDLQGVTASVKPGASEVKIVIDQVIGAEASK